jgi:hypothetical protein
MTSPSTDNDWRSRAVIPIWPDTAGILGVARQTCYDACERGDIPTIRIGRRIVVPVAALRRLLGEIE